MNTRKKIKNVLIILMLSFISSMIIYNSSTVYAANTIDPLIGQIELFPFSFSPRGWVECNGQELSINKYSALYSLIGTRFGGDGNIMIWHLKSCAFLSFICQYYILSICNLYSKHTSFFFISCY